MRYFLIGSVLLIILWSQGCRKYPDRISYAYTVHWRYENQSGIHLDLEAYNQLGEQFEEWEIIHGRTVFFPPVNHDHGVFPFFLRPNAMYSADSVIVRFENGKCLVYTEQLTYDERNIFDLETYKEYEQFAIKNPKPGGPYFKKGPIILTWTFTPEDVAQAVDCDRL
ncbi:MAG: hypothetical protein OXE77_08970 [Flavobacteriaceae bacterium]|nr:hypothetical protein [Flavobacteriaceae bacterium]MCY4268509.1 hypothetical protein [Flavobacteriaceae bacterium]